MNEESSTDPHQHQTNEVSGITFGDGNSTFNYAPVQIDKIIHADEIKPQELNETSPYKGLKRFEQEDIDSFFGRDQFCNRLVNELEQTNLVLLLGASGSGKSSIVRAGVIPKLRQKWGARFVNLTFNPDQDPFDSLYACLLSYYKQAEAKIARSAEGETLTQVVKELKKTDSFWFIFIDQFEELFTTTQTEKCDAFIVSIEQLIEDLNKSQNSSVKIMATMRVDFLDRLSLYPTLVDATDKHRPLITKMQSHELRQAIEQPAKSHGVKVAPDLVEEIIKDVDVQGQAGYLASLQYTLNLLWETEARKGTLPTRTLSINTYWDLGGVPGALQKHVDEIYNALSEPEQVAVQKIFLKLIDISDDEKSGKEWKPVRKRTLRSDFRDELEQDVLAKLIDERLLISDSDDLQLSSQQATVEVVHEILLTSWTTLNSWIRDNRQAIALRNRLNNDVALWQREKSEDELWSGSKLEQALELREDSTFNQVLGGFNAFANQFIDASVERRDYLVNQRLKYLEEIVEEQKKTREAQNKALEEERRARKAAQIRNVIAAIALVVGVFAWWQQDQLTKRITVILLGSDTPDSLSKLLEEADNFRNQIAKLDNSSEQQINQSFAYYRNILIRSHKLRESTSDPSEKKKFEEIAQKAETNLADVINNYRIPQLKSDLQSPPNIGRILPNRARTDPNYYTKGALKTTYEILMLNSGVGADLNEDTFIIDEQEANLMPCKTIRKIEELWREATKNQCGWYGKEGPWQDPGCSEFSKLDLSKSTLYASVIDSPDDYAKNRIDFCFSRTK